MLNQNTGDFLNPVIYKELRQAFSHFSAFKVINILFLAIELFLAVICLSCDLNHDELEGFCMIHVFSTIIAVTISGLLVVSNTARERRVDGLEPLWGTRLTPLQIIRGKVDSALIMNSIPLLISLPLSLCLHPYIWWQMLPTAIFCILTVQMLSLTVACYRDGAMNTANLWIIVPVAGFIFAPWMTMLLCGNHPMDFDSFLMFWLPCTISFTLIGGGACLAVAMLRNTRQNRMLPWRVFTLTAPFIALLILQVTNLLFRNHNITPSRIFNPWIILTIVAACFFIFLSTFECMLPTRRMRRELPENPVLKILSLPFQTGAPAAMLNGLILLAVTTAMLYFTVGSCSFEIICRVFAGQFFYCGIVLALRIVLPKVHPALLWAVILALHTLLGMAAAIMHSDFLLQISLMLLADDFGLSIVLPFGILGFAAFVWALARYIICAIKPYSISDI